MMGRKSVLKDKDGRYVTVRHNGSTLELCAIDRQTVPPVYICTRVENHTIQMAFRFQIGNVYYSAKVNGNSLKVEQAASDAVDFPDSHWFVRENVGGGEHYVLKSVAKPGGYLCSNKNGKHHTFALTADITDGAEVTNK